MNLRFVARTMLSLALAIFTMVAEADAQAGPGNPPLKEVQVAGNAFSLGDPVPTWVDSVAMPPADPTQPVIFRLSDSQWLAGDVPVVFVRRAVMVNDAASLTGAGLVPIEFVPQYQRLQLHAVRVLRGEEVLDRTASSSIRFLERETGLEQGVYSGVVTVSILVNDLRVGDTIEYSYSLHGQNPVFGGKFVDRAIWDLPYPTALRRVVVNYPVTRRIAWRLSGNERSRALVPEESTREGMHKLVFQEQSVAAVPFEPLTPPDHVTYRSLQFSEFSGWDDVVGWAEGLFRAEGDLDDDVREIVGKLRERPTSEDRVAAALEFVQSEIRYFSVSLGESSHRPTSPNIVLKRRYGDCKDKSFLLITLLKELGVQSNPVLVRLGRRKGLDRLLPSPQIFDHVIVAADVSGKIYYLDPARQGQHGRLDRMGQVHEGAQVMVVRPGSRQFSTISSADAPDLARSERSDAAVFSKLGADAQLQSRQVWNGVAAEALRVAFGRMPHAQIVKSISDGMEARYPGSRLLGEPEIRDDQVNNVLTVTARFNVPTLATERNGSWLVRFSASNFKGVLTSLPSTARTAPFNALQFPYRGTYAFTVTFPDAVSVANPSSKTVRSKYFTYAVAYSLRGKVSKTTIDLKTVAPQVEVEDLQKYAEDLRAVDNVITAILLRRGAAIPGAQGLVSGPADRLSKPAPSGQTRGPAPTALGQHSPH